MIGQGGGVIRGRGRGDKGGGRRRDDKGEG